MVFFMENTASGFHNSARRLARMRLTRIRLLLARWSRSEPVPFRHLTRRIGTSSLKRHFDQKIGLAVVTLGGGRTRPADSVDHSVGITRLLPCRRGGVGRRGGWPDPCLIGSRRGRASSRDPGGLYDRRDEACNAKDRAQDRAARLMRSISRRCAKGVFCQVV